MRSSQAGRRRGIPFVVSAPSGTGKTTLCRKTVERDPRIEFSISHTTRPMRPGEQDGVDYHFVGERAFLDLVDDRGFVEFAEYGGNMYGTSWAAIDEPLGRGHDVLLEIEVQGAGQIRDRRDDARLIFLVPPSLESLEARLRGRGTDAAKVIDRRLALARSELEAVERFDYVVVNDDLEIATSRVAEIISAERVGKTSEVRARHGRAGAVAQGLGALGERASLAR